MGKGREVSLQDVAAAFVDYYLQQHQQSQKIRMLSDHVHSSVSTVSSILHFSSRLRGPMQICRTLGYPKLSGHESVLLPHLSSLPLQTPSSPSLLTQLQAMRVAIRREGNWQCSCAGRWSVSSARWPHMRVWDTCPTFFHLYHAPEHYRHQV